MEILHARMEQLPRIMEIYAAARAYMKENGNPTQWGDGYPDEALIRADIEAQKLYTCAENGEILGVFFFDTGEDPTYAHIDGAWLNDRPYAVIHRIAVAVHGRGVAGFCFDACFQKCNNLKIDTHRDNLPMQRALSRHGFVPCGTIYLANGDARIAYQKSGE
ncbi:MAG: GNAT family N-acetyltransferase [Clostridia bacterium]|nr:GNAT family N-acetyltransferase [Clostridia bacterium]